MGTYTREELRMREITKEQWVEHFEIKYNNCLVKAEQFDKPYERKHARTYLYKAIVIRMQMIKEKYCR